MVSGDTGPMHIAAAVGTPIVGIYGPTRPARNGPLAPGDIAVSRDGVCQCHHQRQCRLDAHVPARHRRRRGARGRRSPASGRDGTCPGGAGLSLQRGMPRQSKRDTMIGVIARMRVALGFICGVLVLILARPTGAIAAHRHVDRGARRGASHLGGRASAQGARGDGVRPVPLPSRIRCMSGRR